MGKVAALVDTGAEFSCVRADVAEFLSLTGEPCTFTACSVNCLLADGQRCDVTDAVNLHVKLLSISWDHEFKVLKGGPFPAILGLDFLGRTKMRVDVASRKFSFGFSAEVSGTFSGREMDSEEGPYLQNLCCEVANGASATEGGLVGPHRHRSWMSFQTYFRPRSVRRLVRLTRSNYRTPRQCGRRRSDVPRLSWRFSR